ncbi:hypothetical protein TNCV_1403381 [Trichonephila clavipes]|nr:hypothetical protein TNCV_1403381 [Trichonephila clavipes]
MEQRMRNESSVRLKRDIMSGQLDTLNLYRLLQEENRISKNTTRSITPAQSPKNPTNLSSLIVKTLSLKNDLYATRDINRTVAT